MQEDEMYCDIRSLVLLDIYLRQSLDRVAPAFRKFKLKSSSLLILHLILLHRLFLR